MKSFISARVSSLVKQQWREGELQARWAQQFPMLFDADDLRLAIGKQGAAGFHLVEWLGAILAHHLTGWSALVSKYQLPSHRDKRAVVRRLGLTDLLLKRPARFGKTQGPDLLMFAPDFSDWMLVEVKGPDSLRAKQPAYFDYLEKESGRPIRLIKIT